LNLLCMFGMLICAFDNMSMNTLVVHSYFERKFNGLDRPEADSSRLAKKSLCSS
jgi:hypothetical protein